MEDKIRKGLEKFEDASKILKELKDSQDLSILEEEIKDNKIEFKHKDKLYRVRLLDRVEKEELNQMRIKKFGQLIVDKDILLERDLIDVYKTRGIDIDKLDEDIRKFETEKKNNQLKLGETISNKVGEAVLKTYRDKIEELKEKITLLLLKKSTLLSYSLENQLQNFVAQVITYLSLEIKENEEFIKVFESFELFNNYTDEGLIEKAGVRTIKLHYGI